jgi:hypothetical protein
MTVEKLRLRSLHGCHPLLQSIAYLHMIVYMTSERVQVLIIRMNIAVGLTLLRKFSVSAVNDRVPCNSRHILKDGIPIESMITASSTYSNH